MEHFIDELIKSGVTFIPPFSDITEADADSAVNSFKPCDDDKKTTRKTSIIHRNKIRQISVDERMLF